MVAPVAFNSQVDAAAIGSLASPRAALATGPAARARAGAQDFEAVFLNSMFQHMFTGIESEGPFGGSTGVGVWRSFLTDEYAKSFARSGGIGLADSVYPALIAQQEAKTKPGAAMTARMTP